MKLRLIAIATIVALLTVLAAGQDAEQESKASSEAQMEQQPDLVAVSEPPIKLVHALNPGEREYLSPNLIGLQNIAMTFLPLSMNFVNIIDAYREIVDGVRYEILLNAIDVMDHTVKETAPADAVTTICRLVIIEKPWLRNNWGDKLRELRHSNCSGGVENLADEPAARSKALNDKYPRNAFFNGGSRNELSDDEMAKLEAQIMSGAGGSKRRTSASGTTTTTTTTTTTSTTERAATENETRAAEEAAGGDNEDASGTAPPALNENEMKWLDDILSVGALSFENSRRDAIKANQQHSAATDGSGERQQQSELAEDTNDTQQQLRLPEEDLEQLRQLGQSEQPEKRLERARRSSNVVPGGVSQLDVKKAKKRLQLSLDNLASGDGPIYRISKIHSASQQTVSGKLTKIDAELTDDKEATELCHIEIWSRPWLSDGTEVLINCPSKQPVKTRHSRSVEWAEKKTHKKHNHHNLGKVEHLFNKFQMKFNRRYASSMERQMRMRIFRQNLKTIDELNRNEMGSAKYGITEFADMTSTEYKQRTGLWQRDPTKPSVNEPATVPDIELPKEFDWREKGVVSKVKNQGSCGSCWAFSVTGNIEGLHAVRTGHLEEYSEQELLDCDTVDSACNGGLPDNAYKAIEKMGGLELESDYPYEGRKQQCHFNKAMVHVKVKGAVDLPKNETAMAQWLLAYGPISIGINANAMQFYRGGVSHPWKPLCSHSNLDHGVLIVGYGVSDYPTFKKTLPYWIVKNSWGPKWGEQGYYRVYRGDNTCGLSEMASSAVLQDN